MSKRQGNTINMSSSQTPKNKLSKEMEEELRKQGMDTDIINEYGDVDWENGYNEYGDNSHLEY